jgi:hypothetical protein
VNPSYFRRRRLPAGSFPAVVVPNPDGSVQVLRLIGDGPTTPATLPVTGAGLSGPSGDTPPPLFAPSLDFSDARNSGYVALL